MTVVKRHNSSKGGFPLSSLRFSLSPAFQMLPFKCAPEGMKAVAGLAVKFNSDTKLGGSIAVRPIVI